MRKKSEIELWVEQSLQEHEKQDKADRLLTNYTITLYKKQQYFKTLKKSIIGGFLFGLFVIGALLLQGVTVTSIKDILELSLGVAFITLWCAGFFPVAIQIQFPGPITGFIGFGVLISVAPLLLLFAPLYHIAKTERRRKALIKDYERYPEYYVENPLE